MNRNWKKTRNFDRNDNESEPKKPGSFQRISRFEILDNAKVHDGESSLAPNDKKPASIARRSKKKDVVTDAIENSDD